MTEENKRIRFYVYDALVAQRVDPSIAAPIAQQVGAELLRNPEHDKLYVVRVNDSAGNPHECVVSKLTDSSVLLAPIDVAGLRAMARDETAEEQRVDSRLQDSGTEI